MICRYVAHKDIKRYKKAGWILKNEMRGTYAGQFSVLMIKLTSPEEYELWDEKECRMTKQTGSTTPHITPRAAQSNALTTYATAWVKRGSAITVRERLKNTFIAGVTKVASKIWKKPSGI